MTYVTPEPRRCEVCGRPLKSHNTVGICTGPNSTPECRRARARLERQANGAPPRVRNTCSHPEGCPEPVHGQGLCGTHLARFKRTGKLGPAGLIIKPIEMPAGTVFTRWTTLEDYDRSTDYYVLCRCECGRTERRVHSAALRNGASRSCGCLRPGTPTRRSRGPYMLPGEVYGRLTVLEQADHRDSMVRVRCECGTETAKRASDMKTGHTKSCDCLRRKHGLSKHPLYGIWTGMKSRTSSPANKDYHRYGGRGVIVCERWQGMPEGFLNFVADMGERPPGTTIDRFPDNNGNYEPGNTRWGTLKQQGANTRTVPKLERERDELAARLEVVTKALTAARKPPPAPPAQDALF